MICEEKNEFKDHFEKYTLYSNQVDADDESLRLWAYSTAFSIFIIIKLKNKKNKVLKKNKKGNSVMDIMIFILYYKYIN